MLSRTNELGYSHRLRLETCVEVVIGYTYSGYRDTMKAISSRLRTWRKHWIKGTVVLVKSNNMSFDNMHI